MAGVTASGVLDAALHHPLWSTPWATNVVATYEQDIAIFLVSCLAQVRPIPFPLISPAGACSLLQISVRAHPFSDLHPPSSPNPRFPWGAFALYCAASPPAIMPSACPSINRARLYSLLAESPSCHFTVTLLLPPRRVSHPRSHPFFSPSPTYPASLHVLFSRPPLSLSLSLPPSHPFVLLSLSPTPLSTSPAPLCSICKERRLVAA